MSKLRTVITALITISILFTVFGLYGCGGKDELSSISAYVIGEKLQWEATPEATSYLVDCTFADGSGYSVEVTATTFDVLQTISGTSVFQVIALSGRKKIAQSDNLVFHLGEGGYDDPITISTPQQLKAINAGCYTEKIGDSSYNIPYHYVQTCDIDLGGEEWTPVGDGSTIFRGVYNGGGYTISNFTISSVTTGGWTGFFGKMTDATLANVHLTGFSMLFTKNSGIKGQNSIGCLAGYAENCIIDGCTVDANLNVLPSYNTTGSSYMYVGGLIGECRGSKITRACVTGTVRAQYSRAYVGGIAGYLKVSSDVIANSYCTATVTAVGTGIDVSTGNSYARAYAGGLAGYIGYATRISNCYFAGDAAASVTRDGTDSSYIGNGVMGGTNGSGATSSIPIYNCYYNSDLYSGTRVIGNRTSLKTGSTLSALNGEEFADEASFAGWDFDDIWMMTDGAPRLRGESDITPHTLNVSITADEDTVTGVITDRILHTQFSATANGESYYYRGYSLSNILSNMGITGTEDYTLMTISAEGFDDVLLPLSSGDYDTVYFVYCYSDGLDQAFTSYNGYRLLNTTAGTITDTADTISVKLE